MTDLEMAFARAREVLAEDAARGLTATFAEKLSLYRMARSGLIVWRCTFEDRIFRGIESRGIAHRSRAAVAGVATEEQDGAQSA